MKGLTRELTILCPLIWLAMGCLPLGCWAAEPVESLRLSVSWGHRSPPNSRFVVRLAGDGVSISEAVARGLEDGEVFAKGTCESRAGGGDVDGVALGLQFSHREVQERQPSNPIWRDLVGQSDPDTARRLRLDPGFRPDPRKLTVTVDPSGLRGFSVTVDQLVQNRDFWVPSLDLYLSLGEPSVPFERHLEDLEAWKGRRVLDEVHRQPEASYADYTAKWADMGNPSYEHPRQPAPGHVVGLSWDSALPKFGIDRGAGVWSDLGTPASFRLGFGFAEPARDLKRYWKGQRLVDGWPVVVTNLERDGIRYEVEQFAYPLNGPPRERRGDITMVLLQRVKLHNPGSRPADFQLGLTLRQDVPKSAVVPLQLVKTQGGLVVERGDAHEALLSMQPSGAGAATPVVREEEARGDRSKTYRTKVAELSLPVTLAAGGSDEIVVKLPSPAVSDVDRDKLLALDFASARGETLRFWSDQQRRGVRFQVPEPVVNDLFRANLWHALRLPRRHGGQAPGVKIDLPYSNFAYGQEGTPWPINQAVYVDDMIYDLRGYHDVSLEELLCIYRNNQGPDGHVGGYANWGVYTPGMLYASARYFLLSRDRAGFEKLLPATVKAMDWCLAEIHQAAKLPRVAGGLVQAPLNDLTGEGYWAFNQAYFHAGLASLARALENYAHPRARECLDAARGFQQVVAREFARAAVNSPLVQLRDHTWSPYVPCEAMSPRRLLEQWYPTDVDTGALHLLRLGTISSEGDLADALLNDHEDNLFLKGWGMANEPVYNPQATAYLLRDDPEAVIRAFYSFLACGFSHSALEPVEHRWTWGQYFGPPSTDGAWFELYRNMLIRELDDGGLLLFQASPRTWLEDGKRIEVERAPTFYGKLSTTMESRAASGRLHATVAFAGPTDLKTLLVRFRHPQGKPIQSVTVNGRGWMQFNPRKEWVRIDAPRERHYDIVVNYWATDEHG